MCKKPHFLGLEKDYSIRYLEYVWIILVVVQRDHLIVPRRLYKRLRWQLYSILSCKSGFISKTTTVYKWQKVPCPIFPLRSFTFTLLALQKFFFFSLSGFWFPGRPDLPGQYRGVPASHSHHPLLQHCSLWETDPDAVILVSFYELKHSWKIQILCNNECVN